MKRWLARSALAQLTWTRTLGFLREPEALFWVFAFPVLLALALGIAFRTSGPPKSAVGVEAGPDAPRLLAALAAPDLTLGLYSADSARTALRRGKITVLVRADENGKTVFAYDPARPETRLAVLAATNALERAAGRRDVVPITTDTSVQAGSRYIDFLIPGLLGLNLMGTGMWGVGFPIATMRQQKRLKRMIATPMRRSDLLLSLLLARMVWLVLEVALVLVFARLAFGVVVRGSWPGLVAVTLVAAVAFSALSLLVGSRAKTIEAVSGIMNLVMLPMWLLSGSFFTADRFPKLVQPFVQSLPLTITNNALRAVMNEGASLAAVAIPIAILAAWAVVCFVLALKLFLWE